jgi:signal transduction histidine kinase
MNLISNAIKFTPPGGTINVRVETRDGNMVQTSVRDTGVGIPAAQHSRVFVKFEQVQRPDRQVLSGTELGLAICKQLVELNGGSIGFTSVENQGTTFYLMLPAYAGQS